MYGTYMQHSILQIFWSCYYYGMYMYIRVQNSKLILTIKEEISNSCFIEHMFVCVLHWMILCCLRAIAPYPLDTCKYWSQHTEWLQMLNHTNSSLNTTFRKKNIHIITSTLHKPKCQSGWNFVWPASIQLNSTLLCRPVSTLHIPYLKEP